MMTRYAYAHVRYVGFESAFPNIRLKRYEILFAIGIQSHELYLRLRISAPPIQMICAIENQIHAVSQLLKIHIWHPIFYIFPSFFAPSCRNKSDAVLTMRWWFRIKFRVEAILHVSSLAIWTIVAASSYIVVTQRLLAFSTAPRTSTTYCHVFAADHRTTDWEKSQARGTTKTQYAMAVSFLFFRLELFNFPTERKDAFLPD